MVIGGFTEPQRSRVGLGALLVGYYEGGLLRYAGKVGTGFDTQTLLDLREWSSPGSPDTGIYPCFGGVRFRAGTRVAQLF